MFQNFYELKITGKDVKRFLKKLYGLNIYFENIEMYDKCAYIKVTQKDFIKILNVKTIYKIEIIRLYGFLKLIDYLKKYYIFFISLFLGYILLIFLSNIIFDINVLHSKKEIRGLIIKELNNYGIKKYNFCLSYDKKEEIKNKILENNKDKIEWLEIDRKGVNYEVRVEERIINQKSKIEKPRHVVAKKDAIILDIKASKGSVVKQKNSFVKKGDIIISGLITKNDKIKNIVAADGIIYGETWYKANVNIPYHYKEKNNTGRSKKTIKFKLLNKDFYIFNFNKYKSYEEKNIFKLQNSLLPISLNFSKENEMNDVDEIYTRDEAIIKAKFIAIKKISLKFKTEEKILSSKIIYEKDNNEFLTVTYFFKVYEDITDTIEIINTKVPQ